MEFGEANTVLTFNQAKSHLQLINNNENIINTIEDFLCTWKFKSQYDLELINEDIKSLINVIKIEYFKNNGGAIFNSIYCVVHNLLWSNLKCILRANYTDEDQKLYEKSKIFCKNRRLPTGNDDYSYCSVPYTAAVVELSMWDSTKSPSEKLNCLCITYDIIFAELKSALATLISKYSEKEFDIPIINNNDVIPIITLVFMKSKLRYPFSNLMYIKIFGGEYLEDNTKCYILQTFEKVIRSILEDAEQYLYFENGTVNDQDLDFCEAIEKITLEENSKQESHEKRTIEEENKKRLLSLIYLSTTHKI